MDFAARAPHSRIMQKLAPHLGKSLIRAVERGIAGNSAGLEQRESTYHAILTCQAAWSMEFSGDFC
jgi:hypothetical protein